MRQLGELEAVIMDRLWEWGGWRWSGRCSMTCAKTAACVHDGDDRDGEPASQEKEWLRRDRDGRAWRYGRVSSRSGYTAALMSDALATSADRRTALAHFVLQMSPHDAGPAAGTRPGAPPVGRRPQ
jgi:hypothetical protein